MSNRYQNTHIAPRVLELCQQQPLSVEQLKAHFAGSEQGLVRHHVYNLVKRGQLRNVTDGKCGNGKVGRFVRVAEQAPRQGVPADAGPAALGSSDGRALAAVWQECGA